MSSARLVSGLVLACALALDALLLPSCGSAAGTPSASDPSRLGPPSAADLPELEIRSNGVDRFTTCPPPGALGQHWIPPLEPWTAPAVDAGQELPIDQDFIARTADRTPTELAVEATHRDFRSCYRRGLVRHPTQDGRVAIVLRIDANGRVARVDSYAACELAPESIECMHDVARRLRFPPPSSGSDTITIPATFTSRDGVRRTVPTGNDAYTAAAYVSLEAARPALHACEQRARQEGRDVEATAAFTMTIAPDGHVTKAHIDPWTGDRPLLLCAAHALEALRFTAPAGGTGGTVIARLHFNPRRESR